MGSLLQSGFLNWFPFDPLNLNSEANAVKEIKNGRLAMVRVGYSAQLQRYCVAKLFESTSRKPGNGLLLSCVKLTVDHCVVQVAFVGFATQALVTRQGPLENLTSHLKDPFGSNFLSSIENLPNVVSQTS